MNILNLFRKSKKSEITTLQLSDFSVGLIVKMSPGQYTKHPYYVEIIEVSKDSITTSIPKRNSLRIEVDSPTWKYQIPRMTILGSGAEYGHLLYHQKLN